jgi:hypothetical protein
MRNEPLAFDLVDPNQELNTSLNIEKKLFGSFDEDGIKKILVESGIVRRLDERGYKNYILETQLVSDLDNRIFIKDKKTGLSLVHFRLKSNNFTIPRINTSIKMIYIDWLLTQHINAPRTNRILFPGQNYPGLNIFPEIKKFIYIIKKSIGAYGIFNIPEYFHDAVLFRKDFHYVDPEKEKKFISLQSYLSKYSLKKLSEMVHGGKLKYKSNNETYKWQYGEMLFTDEPFLKEKIFTDEYRAKINKGKLEFTFPNET